MEMVIHFGGKVATVGATDGGEVRMLTGREGIMSRPVDA